VDHAADVFPGQARASLQGKGVAFIFGRKNSLHTRQEINQVIEQLYRRESGRLVSVLTRIFGSGYLELAEDVVQESMMEAVEHWEQKGIPENPPAWLFRVAKNKALNLVNREKYKRKYASDAAHLLRSEWTAEPALGHFFSEEEILDDQLRMMFTCCHPAISPDSQVSLIMKTLCGFGIPEIAKAFLTTEENINKRLVRARQSIREANIAFEVPQGSELEKRLDTVLEAVYLLFNEGYSASRGNDLIRYELCLEAMRLTEILVEHPSMRNKSRIHALLALMQLNAARFSSRQDPSGRILILEDQDRSLWDPALIQKGLFNLQTATSANQLSAYYLLAAISACHCMAPDYPSTDWKAILSLYDALLQLDRSPIVHLNRAIALSKVQGPEEALAALESIRNDPAIKSYHLFYATQAELLMQLNQFSDAVPCLEQSLKLCSTPAEKTLLQEKLNACLKK
jgi:RNA polymerase sigma-70 factor (ECF subfamily)